MAFETFSEAIGKAEENLRTNHPYFAPSDEPLSWDKSGVIRLDYAIYAVHLYAARLTFRSFAHQASDTVKSAAESLGGFIGTQIAKRIVNVAFSVGVVFTVLVNLVEVWISSKAEENVEKAIRRQSIIAQRELLKLRMKPVGKKRRTTEWVRSRHASPPQRKPNKRWLLKHRK